MKKLFATVVGTIVSFFAALVAIVLYDMSVRGEVTKECVAAVSYVCHSWYDEWDGRGDFNDVWPQLAEDFTKLVQQKTGRADGHHAK